MRGNQSITGIEKNVINHGSASRHGRKANKKDFDCEER
jgi:hypothetical protein